jgi:hypothetical protein
LCMNIIEILHRERSSGLRQAETDDMSFLFSVLGKLSSPFRSFPHSAGDSHPQTEPI